MPNYEYVCDSCDHTFDDFLTIDNRDRPIKEPCPKCGVKSVHRGFKTMPSIGYDASVKPKAEFGELINMIKNNGSVPKRFHEKLDQSVSRTGMRLGRKST